MNLGELITVVISSSVIPSHPSTEILDVCLDSIQELLSGCSIILMLDGIRPEQEDRRAAYEDYKRNIRPRENMVIREYPEFRHQAWMLRDTLRNAVKTPLVFFCEHDWQLLPPIPFDKMAQIIMSYDAHFIRLHQEKVIFPCHEYLMREHVVFNEVPLRHCIHFWAQPHLARTEIYLRLLEEHFSEDCRTFIEDKLYGACSITPPEHSKLYIYEPENDMKRVKHLDGRKKTEKFDNTLVF